MPGMVARGSHTVTNNSSDIPRVKYDYVYVRY